MLHCFVVVAAVASAIVIIIIMIIIIRIIRIITTTTFMQGIYNYIPETSHISRVYNVAAVLYSQFMLHVMFLRP